MQFFYNGFFKGIPVFLGYFVSVFFVFNISIMSLSSFENGSLNSYSLSILEFKTFKALDEFSTSSVPIIFCGKNLPLTFKKGISYSKITDKLETPLQSPTSYFSLLSFIISSALPFITSTLFKANSVFISSKKSVFFLTD